MKRKSVKTRIAMNQYKMKEQAEKCDHWRMVLGYFKDAMFSSGWSEDMSEKERVGALLASDFYSGDKYHHITSGSSSIMAEGKNIGLDNVAVWINNKGTKTFSKSKILKEVVRSRTQPKLI